MNKLKKGDVEPQNVVSIGSKGFSGKAKNCVILGNNSEYHGDLDGVVIIGDNIKGLDTSQPNLSFIGDRVVLGDTLFGQPINLNNVIKMFINSK